MALALDNIKKVDMPLKQKKPKESFLVVIKGLLRAYTGRDELDESSLSWGLSELFTEKTSVMNRFQKNYFQGYKWFMIKLLIGYL